ncbi:MAG: HlyD family efflux transporter periplasmic adaptor subunit [Planctomycetes bacterium]|nr:HlyD family efflux transporter periplasmic adaptor subunit [Planctomycetota bacterium]
MSRVLSSLLLFLLIFWAVDAQAAPTNLGLAQTVGEEKKEAEPEESKQVADEKPAEKAKAAAEEKKEEKSDDDSDDSESSADSDEDKKKGEEADEEEGKDDEGDDDKEESKKDDKDSKKEKESDKKPKPHKVERKPLKIEAKIDGVFVAKETHEVALRPESWSQFEVVEAVEHGARVKKGDVLVRFDEEKIDKKIDEESLTQRLSELALMQQEEEYPRIKRLKEISFQEAKVRHEQAKEDYQYYLDIDRPFEVEITNFLYKRSKESLASQQEELDQLLKMYEADEITEETEEIVLRRQRFAVETSELMLKLQTASRDHSLNVSLPRRDERYLLALEEAALNFEQAKTAKEKGLTRLTYEMQQKRDARSRSVERHAKLINDKGLMVVRAPADGIVYYGRCVNGKWSEVTSYAAKLKPFGTVTANKVLMTIVSQRPLCVESAVPEKELPDFKVGLTATIAPTADDEVELTGKVKKVSAIVGGDKKFAMQLDVETDGAPEWLVAGMTGKVTIVAYENKKALVVPKDLVQTDEEDDKIKYVMLVKEDEDEPVRRNVKLGRTKDKLVEVLKGLDEGDEIVKEEKKEEE